ncbi:hypothetical protein J0A68_07550 [Algoriphagus sp. H41]|uniref:Preprotein translocase subunit SecB n=1 Tax=Algoriphagus oliviformis TaxID=2811231 RepID=A0ABS3C5E4_9BACT|nr:hypothetical protein [Algoriphagus oliviformis]MBN7810804.1 hypothetical protein [Algoriphagus oliviformis]
MASQQVTFQLKGISTDEFATIKECYKEEEESVQIETGYTFEIDPESYTVAVRFSIVYKCKESPFIVLKLTCSFDVEKESFDEMLDSKLGKYIIPKGFLTHLTVLTIGTARGVLHAKLDKTGFERYILPTLNVADLIKEDMAFEIPKS